MINHLKITFSIFILTFALSSYTRAELSIDSVYPNVGEINEDLSVIVRGTGFDEHTRVSISLDTGNRRQVIGSVDTVGSAMGVALQGQTAYVADASDGLQVVDMSDPKNPVIIGSMDTPGVAFDVAVLNQIAFVADEEAGLLIIDVSDPENPTVACRVDTPGYARGVAVSGQNAFVADGVYGLLIIDVSDPVNPAFVGLVDTPSSAWGVAVLGQTAYVADGWSGLQIVDVSDPENPAIVGSADTPGYALDVAVSDEIAYIADETKDLQIVDVSDPLHPVIVGSVDTPGWAIDVAVADQTAYVADDTGVQVVDVSDPTTPVLAGSISTPGCARGVTVSDRTAFVADSDKGLQIVDVREQKNLADIGSVDTPGYAYDVAVLDDIAYVADWDRGLQVVDASVQNNPAVIGSVDTPGYAYEVLLLGQTAYLTNGTSGLQVIDVSDPQNPAIVGSVDTPDTCWSVAVAGTTAYLADMESGLQIVDVSDPQNPTIVGSLNTAGYASGVAVLNQKAYVTDGWNGLQIIDVSDPTNPAIVGAVDIPDYANDIVVAGQIAYVTNADYGLQIVDVSDSANPVVIGSVDTPGYAISVEIVNNTAYVADNDAALQAIDVSDPANPVIIGSVDTPGNARGVAVVGQMAYVADDYAGLTVVPVPGEVVPVQVIGPAELQMTLPGPSIAGHYNLRVFNQTESHELTGAVSFFQGQSYQEQLQKKAIVAAGGTGASSDMLVVPVRNSANLAYLTLLSQGYARENIRFLAPHVDWDVDGDGALNDVDDVCSSATLYSAIALWGADSSELIVFLADHGGDGTFYANAGDIVQASDLDAWLDLAQQTIPGKAVLIYDACYSGSFLADMVPPSGKERIVVTSSLSDERAWFMNDGALSFGYQFWASVFLNANLYESFIVARNMMAHEQTAVLDANGDGGQSKADIQLARDFVIGRGRIAASTPPAIGEVSGEQVLSGTSSANLWASNITALNEIERVWAVIVPPDFDNGGGEEVTGLDTVELNDHDQDGVYTGAYDQFVLPGTYDVFVYASDVFEALSLPKATTVFLDYGMEEIVYIHSSGDCGAGREPCYDTVQQGLEETGGSNFKLKIGKGDYHEDVTAAIDCHYTLSGGYDSGYENQNGLSAIIGSLTITKGTLEVENLVLGGL